ALAVAPVMAQEAATVSAAPEAEPAPVTALEADNAPATWGDAAAGAGKAAVCAACHGMDGNAVDPQYPKLAGQHEQYIARQLALFKTAGAKNAVRLGFAPMPSPKDRRDVGANYAGQKATPGGADDSRWPKAPMPAASSTRSASRCGARAMPPAASRPARPATA